MRKKVISAAAFALTGIIAFSSAVPVSASMTAGVTNFTNSMLVSSSLPTAGISLAFSQCITKAQEEAVLASATTNVVEKDTPTVASANEYANMAVAQVNDYVNIRSEASEEGEVLGKLYDDSVATVEETENGWYKITSGSVEGYVKAEYVSVGDEDLIKSVGKRLATVTTTTLNVRKSASTDAGLLGQVPEGDDLLVVDESTDGWVGVSIEEGTGYVSSDYVTVDTEYTYAESKEEEKARLAAEEAQRKAAEEAAAARTSSKSSSKKKATGAQSYSSPTGSTGQDVADFAVQFVGNPYVYGGTSLTKGADCSGFVMSVYKEFGVSLPHSSKSLRSSGYSVSVDEMQAGDIICYSGHVAIYIGGGKIVHASTPSTGIKISSPVNYKKILAVRRIF